MLKKLKRPELYINHGVWVFLQKTNELVKRKINSIEVVYYHNCDFSITSVYVQDIGKFSPEDVYMTRKEAFKEEIKKLQTALKESQDEMEWQEHNMNYQLKHYKNKVECKKRDLKDILESHDHFLEKIGVSKEQRDQYKFFSELGFKEVK